MAESSHELRIGLLEKQSQRIDESLQKLAEDMHKLTGFSIQQAEDRSALTRAFSQIDSLKVQFERSTRDVLIKENEVQQKQIDEAQAARKTAVSELFKILLLMAGALIVGHFGGKLL